MSWRDDYRVQRLSVSTFNSADDDIHDMGEQRAKAS